MARVLPAAHVKGEKMGHALESVVDSCGNTAIFTQKITVNDTAKPIVTIDKSKLAKCYLTLDAAIADVSNNTSASDGCSGPVTPKVTGTGTCDVLLTATATDACQNTAAGSLSLPSGVGVGG